MIVRNPRAELAEALIDEAATRYRVAVPTSALTLEGFRDWARSDDFPRHGRISFIGSEVIVDMSPERFLAHGAVKAAVSQALTELIRRNDLGEFYPDRTLLTFPPVELSHEPDAMFASWETLRRKRLKPIPTADEDDFIEWEGVPDLVVEILSPTSARTDTRDLLPRYFRAGVPECWLIDARKGGLQFQILVPGPVDYQAIAAGRSGWLRSPLFGRRFLLDRERNRAGRWQYTLHVRR